MCWSNAHRKATWHLLADNYRMAADTKVPIAFARPWSTPQLLPSGLPRALPGATTLKPDFPKFAPFYSWKPFWYYVSSFLGWTIRTERISITSLGVHSIMSEGWALTAQRTLRIWIPWYYKAFLGDWLGLKFHWANCFYVSCPEIVYYMIEPQQGELYRSRIFKFGYIGLLWLDKKNMTVTWTSEGASMVYWIQRIWARICIFGPKARSIGPNRPI